MSARYRVLVDDAVLWQQSYTATVHGSAMSVTPGRRQEVKLAAGDVIELVDYRPSSPGSDVISLPWCRSSAGEGFLKPIGPWGTLRDEVVERVES